MREMGADMADLVHGKKASRPFDWRLTMPLIALHASTVFAAGPLPQGGQFKAGTGTITTQSTAVNITQSSARGVIDWSSFSIGAGNTVSVNNGSGATLSRVTGTARSQIDGNLNATGSLYLINPQGVVIGANGVVTTGGRFIASALDAGNDAFMAGGPLTFSGGGSGAVVNMGTIGSTGGDVLLIARSLAENDGTISAPKGTAELAAGGQVLVRDTTSVPQTYVQSTAIDSGDAVNKGAISATQIALQAADGNVYALAGAHSALRATGAGARDGHVWLIAQNGTAHVHARIDATNADGSGGTLDTTSHAVHLDNADIHAAQWNLSTPAINVGPVTAAILTKQLSQGTSVAINATSGDINIAGLRWSGNSALTLNAYGSVTIVPGATLGNTGGGNLMLRADATGIDNAGAVFVYGAIDWSRSTGIVSTLSPENGGLIGLGPILTNPAWTAAPYSGLKTQFTNYLLVNSLSDMQYVAANLNGNFALGKDVTIPTGTTFYGIGVGADLEFNGQFDGMGHVLRGLSSSQPDSGAKPGMYTGLFAVIGTEGVVRNLGVDGTSSPSANGIGGVLAGRNRGLITHSYSTGFAGDSGDESTGTGGLGGSSIGTGGLVGRNDGTIERSWSSAGGGYSGAFGGLVDQNNGTIVQSFATGLTGSGRDSASAGLVFVNSNTGTIRQSYAAGLVDGWGESDAGLVSDNLGKVDESFSAAVVSNAIGPAPRSGLFIFNTPSGATSVFWDKDITGQRDGGPNVPASNGLTTAQMSNPASFGPRWDFGPNGTWAMPTGATHPVLRWQLGQQ